MGSLVGVTALMVLIAVAPAAATQGSVPEEVAAYASDPRGLLATLDDVAGVDASGNGIDFRDGAVVGSVNRVFRFTDDWLAGRPSDPAIELRNEWVAPISVDEKPVGVAIIWINDSTVTPGLADFMTNVELTTGVMDVAADAWIIRDEPRNAWFALQATELTALQPGDSTVSGDTSLPAYQSFVAGKHAMVEPENRSIIGPAAVIGGVALLVVVAVVLPLIRRRRHPTR